METCPSCFPQGTLRPMKLEDLPRLVPGATVRVKLQRGLVRVSIKHSGREGTGVHPELTFATRRAVLSLQASP